MKRSIGFIIIILLLACACDKNSDISAIPQLPDPANIMAKEIALPENIEEGDTGDMDTNVESEYIPEPDTKPDPDIAMPELTLSKDIEEGGEGKMDERLITKDELLEYIQTHSVGLSLEDFDDINVDELITRGRITTRIVHPSNLNTSLYLETALRDYKRDLEWNERAKYMAQEKCNVESTDSEYERFIKEFFAAIGAEAVTPVEELGFHRYNIYPGSGTTDRIILYIAQTKNIDELNVYTNEKSTRPALLEVFIANGPDGAGVSGNFCYSKNKKYMLLANLYDGQLFEYVKVFCEMAE
jgi:hypothetical protein